MPVNFNAIKVEENDSDMLLLDKAKSECYDVFNMKREDFAQIMKDEKKPLLYFDPAKPLFRQSYLHHVAGKPAHMPMLKVETFPSYIYSPLRVLNPYVHTEPDPFDTGRTGSDYHERRFDLHYRLPVRFQQLGRYSVLSVISEITNDYHVGRTTCY